MNIDNDVLIVSRSDYSGSQLSTSDTPYRSINPVTSTEQKFPPLKCTTEHVQLVKDESTNCITVRTVSICCRDLVGLNLECVHGNFADRGADLKLPTVRRDIKILIGCLDVDISSLATPNEVDSKIIVFDDPADCLSRLLSITDELIYFVVNETLGRFVVPLTHDHRSVEHIYVYQDSQDEQSSDWVKNYSKTQAVSSSINVLINKIQEDVRSIIQRPAHWSRSRALLTQLCSQTFNFKPIEESCEEDLNTCRIVLLDHGGRQLFNLSHPKMSIVRCRTVKQCFTSIQDSPQSSVFVLVPMLPLDELDSILTLEAVHAVYIVIDVKSIPQLQTIPTHTKLCGIFALNEDLLDQLTSDICFYRQMRVQIPNISIFQVKSTLIDKSSGEQIDFLRFQLFSAILSQIPVQSTEYQAQSYDQLLTCLTEANVKIDQLFKQFNTSMLEASVNRLKEIDHHIVSLSQHVESSTDTVYRAQLISQKDLAMIRDNPKALFAIQAFILASRSLSSIVKICRQAKENQLAVVLLELKLSKQASVMHIPDSNLVVFKLGTLFRLISAELAPDNVLHVQLEYGNNAMQYIEDKFQNLIGHRLNWLTFGKYFEALPQSSSAEAYYKYLVTIIPDHPNIATICNDMGQISATPATTLHKIPAMSFDDRLMKQLSSSDEGTEKIKVLRRMADISYRRPDYTTALVLYRQALELDDHLGWKEFYQYRIDTLLNFHCP